MWKRELTSDTVEKGVENIFRTHCVVVMCRLEDYYVPIGKIRLACETTV
jgi:hypothetical protein